MEWDVQRNEPMDDGIVLPAVYPVLLGTGKRFPAKAGLRAEPLSFADGSATLIRACLR